MLFFISLAQFFIIYVKFQVVINDFYLFNVYYYLIQLEIHVKDYGSEIHYDAHMTLFFHVQLFISSFFNCEFLIQNLSEKYRFRNSPYESPVWNNAIIYRLKPSFIIIKNNLQYIGLGSFALF